MGASHSEARSVISNRKLVRGEIFALVAEHFPDFKPHDRLPGYRYCFSRKLKQSPTSIPVFLHLVVQHHRRKGEVLGYWEASYFSPPRVGRELPSAVSAVSKSFRLENRSKGAWESFRASLAGFEIDGLLEKLKDHDDFEIALWQYFRNEKTRAQIPAQYETVIRDLVAQPGFSMSQPTRLNIADFVKNYVPQDARPEEGQFSLESSRARRKLADFQLTDPQSFVVHLISGAIAGGAEKVDVYVDSDDIIVEFGGRPLDRTALKQLFSNLLSGRASPQGRELAVALNAASSLDPKLLLIESWRNGQGVVLEIDEEGERIREMTASPPGEGHRVHFRDRPSLKTLKRFLNSLKREHPEVDLIRNRCARAPVPILLEHREDCRDFAALQNSLFHLYWSHPDQPLLTVPLRAPCKELESPLDASILLTLGPEEGLEFLIHGVRYEPPEKVELKGLHALVCDNRASRDLSFTGLVADERWSSLKEHLEAGRDTLLGEAKRHFERLEDSEESRLWAPVLRAKARRGASEFLGLRIFERLDGTLWERATLLNQPINFTSKEWTYGLRSGVPVYRLDREDQDLLWGGTFRNVDRELASSHIYFAQKESWLGKAPLLDIRFQRYQGPRHRLSELDGEVVLAGSPHFVPKVLTFAQGRPLPPIQNPDLPPGVKVMVNHDGLDVDDHWKELLPNKALEEVRRVAEIGAHEFFESLMESSPEHNDLILHYLLYLKAKGGNWLKFTSRINLKSDKRGQVTLDQILDRSGGDHSWEAFWEESQRLMKTLAVPVTQLMLVRKLSE